MGDLLAKSTEEVKRGHQSACAHRREQMKVCPAGHVSAGRHVRLNEIERRSKQQPANAALLRKIERDRSGRATPAGDVHRNSENAGRPRTADPHALFDNLVNLIN